MTPLLEIRNLTLSFQKRFEQIYALRGASFQIFPSEIVAIVGESGCGKSAMARAILGLLPSNGKILSGNAIFDGIDLLELSPKKLQEIRGRKIGMIFQDPFLSLNPTMKIGHQISEILLNHKICHRSQVKQVCLTILNNVRIDRPDLCFYLYPHQLSGGMKQRIMIAIAIACHPSLLIADEPTTALDASVQIQILNLLKEIQQRFQMSILLITHNMSVVSNICDKVLVMYAGEIVEWGKVEDVLNCPKHPYTQMLLESVPTLDKDKFHNRLKPISGSLPIIKKPICHCPFVSRCPYAMNICARKTPLTWKKNQNVKCWLYDPKATKESFDRSEELEKVLCER